jgi:hypothetical protein
VHLEKSFNFSLLQCYSVVFFSPNPLHPTSSI